MFDETTDAGPTELRPICLEITLPDIPPYTVSLTGESEVVLGRARSARVQLDHRTVSREHARLRLSTAIDVEDLGSRNGTRVRGADLIAGQVTVLGLGEIFEVGSVVL